MVEFDDKSLTLSKYKYQIEYNVFILYGHQTKLCFIEKGG